MICKMYDMYSYICEINKLRHGLQAGVTLTLEQAGSVMTSGLICGVHALTYPWLKLCDIIAGLIRHVLDQVRH